MINYGFRQPNIKIEDHIFGVAETGNVINESGQWDAFLPQYEPQAEYFETQGCTVWGTQNSLETLHKCLFNEESNYSERFTYILAGINFQGGDAGKVAEVVRNTGLIDHWILPMTETAEEFIKPDPMDELYLKYGKEWLAEYSFGHQWVIIGGETKEQKISAMKEALQYSPLGVAVSAWHEGPNDVYIDNGMPNCHWCMCYGWDDDKHAWKIFDSYDHDLKLYSYDALISVAKRYTLTKRTTMPAKNWWIEDMIINLWDFSKEMVLAFISLFKKYV